MNECWKCQVPLPEGQIECSLCSAGVPLDLRQAMQGQTPLLVFSSNPPKRVKLDMSKVKTLEDVLAIIQAMELQVEEGSDAHTKLKKFLP